MSSFWPKPNPPKTPPSGEGQGWGRSLPVTSFHREQVRVPQTPPQPLPRGRGSRSAVLLFLSLLPLSSWAGPYADLDAQLGGKPDAAAVAGLRRVAGDDQDALDALAKGPQAARAYVGLRATLEGAPPTAAPAIGPAPTGERIASSWLSRALGRFRAPDFDLPSAPRSSVGVGPWATTLMWGILGALGAYALFMLARYVRLPKGKGKKRLVDPDEPLRSSDAWLEDANGLIAQGRYRDAVRGLYVAGLMRFDEANVARFDRHQTNWEHLRRIEASPRRPEGTDVRLATARFDRLWYGHIAATRDDAAAMRAWYDALVQKLAEARP